MRKLLPLLVIFVVIFLVGGLLFFYANTGPVSADTNPKNFVINQGDSLNNISQRLEKFGFIKNRYVFMILVYKMGLNNKLQAGLFRLSSSLDTGAVITKLSTGGSHDYWFKIIEGTRIEEIANSLPSELTISTNDFITQASSKEGYLFPDSYLIPQGYSLTQIFDITTTNFNKKLAQAKVDSTNTDMSDAEIITLASLLEREARSLKAKQEIAGIMLNRLGAGIALQVDATIQYARDSKTLNKPDKVFWKPITKNDLEINSPFNTYHNPGLPPAPICNPGYDSIYAAYHPIASDYLYYITGKDGQMHYAKTLPEHNANIAKYLK